MKKYQIIYADPPWDIGVVGIGKDTRQSRSYKVGGKISVPYKTMSQEEIRNLPVKNICDDICHLWLWTTNSKLHEAFHVMESWGFKYLNTITYNKPSGFGPWFVNTTQHLLFGYKGKLVMGKGRYALTSQYYIPKKHSKKPQSARTLIESVSPYDRKIELFAREKTLGWDVWGNEVQSDIIL